MAIKFTTTGQTATSSGLKILIHGESGSGKTTLLGTTGEPTVIISAEGGMLSLAKMNMPVIEVSSMADMREAYAFLQTPQGKQFRWVGLDSVSEIAEKILAAEKRNAKDPRKAYGEMNDQLWDLVRGYRDMPDRDVVFIAKQERMKDDSTGITSHLPSLPGKSASQGIDYFFDEVFALRVDRNPADPSQSVRYLQTGRDFQYAAKDRSGALAHFDWSSFLRRCGSPALRCPKSTDRSWYTVRWAALQRSSST